MITIGLFAALLILAVVLLIYSILDSENRVYANILASLFATILFLVLSGTIVSGAVQDYTADATLYTVQDSGISWILLGMAIVSGILTVFYILEIMVDQFNERNPSTIERLEREL